MGSREPEPPEAAGATKETSSLVQLKVIASLWAGLNIGVSAVAAGFAEDLPPVLGGKLLPALLLLMVLVPVLSGYVWNAWARHRRNRDGEPGRLIPQLRKGGWVGLLGGDALAAVWGSWVFLLLLSLPTSGVAAVGVGMVFVALASVGAWIAGRDPPGGRSSRTLFGALVAVSPSGWVLATVFEGGVGALGDTAGLVLLVNPIGIQLVLFADMMLIMLDPRRAQSKERSDEIVDREGRQAGARERGV